MKRLAPVAFAVLAAASAAGGVRDRAALRAAQEQARAAYEKKDYAGFLAQSGRVASLAPHSTRALYNLACAHALSGHPREALALLRRLAHMGLAFQPAEDADLASLKDHPEFESLRLRFYANSIPLQAAWVAFSLPQRDLITEGIAHDPVSGAFFVSSVHRRKIVRVDKAGVVRDFTEEGQDGLMAVMALGVDARRRSLWASTQGIKAMVGFRPEDAGRSLLFEYDVDTGRLRRRVESPAAAGRLVDLTVAPGGDLYVSDAAAGAIYRLGAGAPSLRTLVGPGTLESPQGLALSSDGRALYVADYTQGIVRVDLRTGAAVLMDAPQEAALTGIDGLVSFGRRDLIAIQNGTLPHRVLRLRLDRRGRKVKAAELLERANNAWDEPTLGVLVGDDLYYVAASQYGAIRDDGSLDRERLREPTVMRLPLGWRR